MDLVLQAQGESGPIAPRDDLSVAISLLQMSVLGLPLLLALFQFVNDHKYENSEDHISTQTFIYALVMVVSAVMLWGFYFTAVLVIQSEIGWNPMMFLLFFFMIVLFMIIMVILAIQLEQMVGEGLRYSLLMYLTAVGLSAISVVQPGNVLKLLLMISALIAAGLGAVNQYIGLEQARKKLVAWKERKSDPEKTEDEGMESVYK